MINDYKLRLLGRDSTTDYGCPRGLIDYKLRLHGCTAAQLHALELPENVESSPIDYRLRLIEKGDRLQITAAPPVVYIDYK